MNKKLGDQTIVFENFPKILTGYSVVGEKEGNGNLKDYFDYVLKNDEFEKERNHMRSEDK